MKYNFMNKEEVTVGPGQWTMDTPDEPEEHDYDMDPSL
jgi:hypothetical protein